MAKCKFNRGMYNIVMLSLSYFCAVTTFFSLFNMYKIIIDDFQTDYPNYTPDATYCWVLFETSLCLSVILSPFFIRYVTEKWTIVIAHLLDVFLPMHFFFPRTYLMYIFTTVSGFCAAMHNVATGTLLALNSRKEQMGRNSALYWFIAEFSKIVGNIFILSILHEIGIGPTRRSVMFGVFTGLIGVAALLSLAMMKPVFQPIHAANPRQILGGIFRLLESRDVWLYMVTFFYVGMLGSFEVGLYSSAIAYTPAFSATNKKKIAAIAGICLGVGQAIASILFTIFGKTIHNAGRQWIILAGSIVHGISYVIIFLNIPNVVNWKEEVVDRIFIWFPGEKALIPSNIYLAFFCSVLLGLGDSCFHTQIFSLIGNVFEREASSGFMLFKLTQKTAAAVLYGLAGRIGQYALVLSLIATLVLGTASFFYAHYKPTYVSHNPILVFHDDLSQTRDYKNAEEEDEHERQLIEAEEKLKQMKKEEKATKRKK